MRRILRQCLYSRVTRILSIIVILWIAGELWYEMPSEDVSALEVVQVGLATVLAVVFLAAFFAERGWRKHNDGPE